MINLDHRLDRWKYVYHQLTAVAGLPPERIERVSAVDGRALLLTPTHTPNNSPSSSLPRSGDALSSSSSSSPPRQGETPYRADVLDALCETGLLSRLGRLRLEAPEGEKIWGMDLTPGAVGCALSHLDVWQRVLRHSAERVFVSHSSALIDEVFPPHSCLHKGEETEEDVEGLTETPQKEEEEENGKKGKTSHPDDATRVGRKIMSSSWPHPPMASAAALPSHEEPFYLIVEDDALFATTPPFLQAYEQRVTLLERQFPELVSWDVLHVGGLDTGGQCPALALSRQCRTSKGFTSLTSPEGRFEEKKMPCCSPLPSLSGIARVPQLHRTTTAYVVTPVGAERLLRVCFPLTFQLDTEMTRNVGHPSRQHEGGYENKCEVNKGSKREGVVDAPAPAASTTAAAAALPPYVLDPPSLTLQPPLVCQCPEWGSDIQWDLTPDGSSPSS